MPKDIDTSGGYTLPKNGNIDLGSSKDIGLMITQLRAYRDIINSSGVVSGSTADYSGAVTVDGAFAAGSTVSIDGATTLTTLQATGAVSLDSTTVATGLVTMNAGADIQGGVLSLDNAVIDNTTAADIIDIGGKIGICTDASPSASIDGIVLYYDETNLFAKNAADEVATLNSAAFA